MDNFIWLQKELGGQPTAAYFVIVTMRVLAAFPRHLTTPVFHAIVAVLVLMVVAVVLDVVSCAVSAIQDHCFSGRHLICQARTTLVVRRIVAAAVYNLSSVDSTRGRLFHRIAATYAHHSIFANVVSVWLLTASPTFYCYLFEIYNFFC
jgi:hypothetical protein